MSEDLEVEESGPDRRSIMKAAALVAVPVAGAGVVAACSSSTSGGSGSPGGSGANVSVPSSSVPVGGGTVNAGIVVTQPESGVYKAFSAVCTHQGCTVKEVADNQIHCPCHGSIFSAKDGSVLAGPATKPLSALNATLSGTNVTVAGAAKG